MVESLDNAVTFFTALGLELEGGASYLRVMHEGLLLGLAESL